MRTIFAAAALLLCTPAVHAQPARYDLDPRASKVWFDASATLGRFQGTAGQVGGWADAPDTVTLTGARGQVDVAASTFRTGNSMRDQHLRTEMDVRQHPFVRLVVDSTSAGGGNTLVLHGKLVVKERATPVTVNAATTRTPGTIHLAGSIPTRFTALGMQPPTRMAGLTRVRDEITLHFDVVFRRR